MDLAITYHFLVERVGDGPGKGDPKLLDDYPIPSDPSIRVLVDRDHVSGEVCEQLWCEEFQICPSCHRGQHGLGIISLKRHRLTLTDPLLTPGEAEAIKAKAVEVVQRKLGFDLTRINDPSRLIQRIRAEGIDEPEDDDEIDDTPRIILP